MTQRCPTCGSKYAVWTPARIVEAAQKYAAEQGRNPQVRDWRRGTAAWPANTTVYKHFKAWADLIEAAGLPAAAPRWNRERIVEAVFQWRYEYGCLPVERDWCPPPEGYPTSYNVRWHFGSWSGAIVAAGYVPDARRGHRSVRSYRSLMAARTKASA